MAKEQRDTKDVSAEVRAEVQHQLNGVLAQIQQKIQADKTGLAQLAAAYIAARKQCRMAVKNAQNPHLRNTYADLGSILEAVTDAFLDNDLWLQQSPGDITVKEGKPYIALHGLLLHASGQSIGYKMELPAYTVSKSGEQILNPQTAGSALSYARRYMWAAVAGITQVDDDADAASYIDMAKVPQAQVVEEYSIAAKSTPQSNSAADEMITSLTNAKTFDELKALRVKAQDLANSLNDKRILATYMDRYNEFKGAKVA